jgi:flagellar protein FliO/FliZ
MFETLFGAEMPLAVRFFLAFLIVLGLIGLTAWAVRRFGTGRLGGAAARGRQPRLAVIDYASVDGRRRLILVRRDNVEHLLMIGGPTDVVVEPNIVRAVAAPRDATTTRPTAGIDALPRAIPLPENGNGSWPLQPEPTAGLRPAPRVEPLPDELPFRPTPPQAEPAPRPQRDTLAALADELSTRPAPTPPRNRPAMPPRAQPAEPRAELKPEMRSPVAAPAMPAPPAASAAAAEAASNAADESLADMAQRLEAALRKPGAGAESNPVTTSPRAPAEHSQPSAPAMPRPPRPSEGRPARAEAKPNQSKTTLYDSLEQEMASLLGRPTKT